MMPLLRDAKRFIEDIHRIHGELDKSLDDLKKTTDTLEAIIEAILKGITGELEGGEA